MPKKSKPSTATSKKSQKAPASNKVTVDKTFGLKNKKGKKAAAVIRSAKPQESFEEERARKREADRARAKEQARREQIEKDKKLKQEMEEKRKKELEERSKILCEFFERGECKFGASCEYLHDWKQVKRVEKIDFYTDPRLGTENYPGDKANICDHFLEAVKSKKYGFFWVCPNKGNKCHYKHFLPPGYLLPQEKTEESEDEEERIEDVIDSLRNELIETKAEQTKLTFESLAEWWSNWKKEKQIFSKESKKIEKDGKPVEKGPSGKAYFLSNPEFKDDDSDESEKSQQSEETKSQEQGMDEENQDGRDRENKKKGAENEKLNDESLFLEEELDDINLDELNF